MSLPEVGEDGQTAISTSRVLVIGAGGLGCPALQYLAAAGVGHISIVDPDEVSESNLHRQVLFNHMDLGENKAIAAAEKLSILNPQISVTGIPEYFNKNNAETLVSQHDLVIDGSDNFSTRYLVNDACVIQDKPWVFASLRRFEIQVSVFNYNNGPSYRCLFPEPPSNIPNCSEEGIFGPVAGMAGSVQAMEALKVILKRTDVLSGQLWCINALNLTTSLLKFRKQESNFKMTELKNHYQFDCFLEVEELDAQTIFNAPQNFQIIDIREEAHPSLSIAHVHSLSINKIAELAASKEAVLVCSTGRKSQQWAALISQNHGIRVYSLKGGLESIDLDHLKV